MTTAYRAGLRRGLDACASPRGVFTVLALDHRQNLRREIRPDDPDSVSIDEMADLKRDVVRALAGRVSGVLLDPEFGAPRCIADGSLPGSVGLIVAIEATGYEGPSTARRSRILDGWSVAKAKRMAATAAKLLVYYHPDAATQQTRSGSSPTLPTSAAASTCRCSSSPSRTLSIRRNRPSSARIGAASSSRPRAD